MRYVLCRNRNASNKKLNKKLFAGLRARKALKHKPWLPGNKLLELKRLAIKPNSQQRQPKRYNDQKKPASEITNEYLLFFHPAIQIKFHFAPGMCINLCSSCECKYKHGSFSLGLLNGIINRDCQWLELLWNIYASHIYHKLTINMRR